MKKITILLFFLAICQTGYSQFNRTVDTTIHLCVDYAHEKCNKECTCNGTECTSAFNYLEALTIYVKDDIIYIDLDNLIICLESGKFIKRYFSLKDLSIDLENLTAAFSNDEL